MAYIDIEIEEYLDEVDSEYLIDELKKRAGKEKKCVYQYIKDELNDGKMVFDVGLRSLSQIQEMALHLGLNHLASKEDIIKAILEL